MTRTVPGLISICQLVSVRQLIVNGENVVVVFWGVYLITKTNLKWQEFSERRDVIEHLPDASRPSTSVNDEDREIAEDLNISYGTTEPFWLIFWLCQCLTRAKTCLTT